MTDYIILRWNEASNAWKENGAATSSSPERAIRLINDVGEGKYVAVPLRSWKPLTVKVEQTTKVTIG